MEQKAVRPAAGNREESFIKGSINISRVVKGKTFAVINDLSRFREKLEEVLSPNLPAKELVIMMVRAALETEFGKTFTLMAGFDKMVIKISDSIMTDPALRRQALSVVSIVVDGKITEREKKN